MKIKKKTIIYSSYCFTTKISKIDSNNIMLLSFEIKILLSTVMNTKTLDYVLIVSLYMFKYKIHR